MTQEMPERITFGWVRAMGERFLSVVIDHETKCEVIKKADYIRADLVETRADTSQQPKGGDNLSPSLAEKLEAQQEALAKARNIPLIDPHQFGIILGYYETHGKFESWMCAKLNAYHKVICDQNEAIDALTQDKP